MNRPARRGKDSVAARARSLPEQWRAGTSASQVSTLLILLVGVAISFGVSLAKYEFMPMAGYFLWLLIGMLLLRFRPLVLMVAWTALAAIGAVVFDELPIGAARITAITMLAIACALILYQGSRQRSGLPVPLSESLFADLRDRLQSQSKVPPLPEGWRSQSAMKAADGASYAGDFLVADLSDDKSQLEMILVDVCGKGITAGTQALQFSGALGGLIGALPPAALLTAANDFLLRQDDVEALATAVHVVIDLRTGDYSVTSAGHPPALRWCSTTREWQIDGSRGMALGVTRRPELVSSTGNLGAGDALLFYTDGVIERPGTDIDESIDWLRGVARRAAMPGFDGAADRILKQVGRGDDDRAVLILSRDLA